MELNLVEKLKILCDRAGISVAELGRRMGKSPQNFSQQMKRGDFRLSDIEKMADILGYSFQYDFIEKPRNP